MAPVSKVNGIMKSLEIVPIYLRERIGTEKVALVYVICNDVNPAVLEKLAPDHVSSEEYESLMDILIAVTSYVGAEYTEDNTKVYQILQE